MRVLVVGGAGFIGSALVAELRRRGVSVVIASRRVRSATAREESLTWDVNEQWLGPVPKIDAMVHLAGPNGDEVSEDDEGLSTAKTRNVIELCRKIPDCGLLYFSTFQVFGRWSGEVTDGTLPSPRNAYAQSHLRNELLAYEFGRSQHRPVMMIRPTNIFGVSPNQRAIRWHRVPADFCRQAIADRRITIKGSPNDFRDFLPVSVLAKRAADLLGSKERWDRSARIIGSGTSISLLSMAHRVAIEARRLFNAEVSVHAEQSGASTGSELRIIGQSWQGCQLTSNSDVDLDGSIRELLRAALNESDATAGTS